MHEAKALINGLAMGKFVVIAMVSYNLTVMIIRHRQCDGLAA